MKRLIALGIAFAASAAPLAAAPGGNVDTIPLGGYVCETPGDATGPAGIRQPTAEFTAVSGSSYTADGTMGSYLVTGDTIVMTSGARKGQRFRRVGNRTLHLIGPDGRETNLRCVANG